MEYKFDEFKDLLKEGFAKQKHLITEDVIRHWYIHLIGNIDEAEIEKMYNQIIDDQSITDRTRIDLYYSKQHTAIEFKYHKKIDSSGSCTTDNCGSVFGDMNRLSHLPNVTRLLIYVFDDEMHQYNENNCRQLNFDCGKTFNCKDIFVKRPATFKKRAFGDKYTDEMIGKYDYSVKVVYDADWGDGKDKFYLRVYEIQK